jgi:ABC-type multidrug transport system fused ATPase/permease subunit
MSEAELLEDKVDPSLDFALWARVLRFARPYRRALTCLALAGIVLAMADVCLPLITKWVIDDATTPEGGGRILALSLLYLWRTTFGGPPLPIFKRSPSASTTSVRSAG